MYRIIVYLLMMLFMSLQMMNCYNLLKNPGEEHVLIENQLDPEEDEQVTPEADKQKVTFLNDQVCPYDDPERNKINLNDDVMDRNRDLDLLTTEELVENLGDIDHEMRSKKVDSFSYNSHKELFQRFFQSIVCEWYPKAHIDEIRQKHGTCNYSALSFGWIEEGSLEESKNGCYMMTPVFFTFEDIVGVDYWINIKEVHIDKEDDKKFYVTYYYAMTDTPEYCEFVLDYSNPDEIKILVPGGEEYVYLDTSLNNFIKQQIFVGKYVDQDGVSCEFKNNNELVYGDQTYLYDPYELSLAIDFDVIQVMNTDYTNSTTVGFIWKNGRLLLYHTMMDDNINYGNPFKQDQPFITLTKID